MILLYDLVPMLYSDRCAHGTYDQQRPAYI